MANDDCGTLILRELRARRTMMKRDIKDFMVKNGFRATGAGPLMNNLQREGCVEKGKKFGQWRFLKMRTVR